jgi:hypothetical protein
MNKINKSNYEEYLIDHLDGTLSKEGEAELLLFLEAHPDIKAEFEGIDEMVLGELEAVFECRDCLKKSVLDSSLVNEENFEHFCIAYAEGDLSEIESEHLMNYLHDFPSLQQEFSKYAKLKLQADPSVSYGDKVWLTQFADQSDEAISLSNYQDFIIASEEENLSEVRQLELQAFLHLHPELQEEARVFALLKLKPDTEIVFANKASLKRRVLGFAFANNWMNVAAASVAIFMFFYFIIPTDKWDNTVNDIEIRNTKTELAQIPLEEKEVVQVEEKIQEPKIAHKSRLNHKKKRVSNTVNEMEREGITIAKVELKQCDKLIVNYDLDNTVLAAQFLNEIYAEMSINSAKTVDEDSEKVYEIKGFAGKYMARVSKRISKTGSAKKGKFKDQLIAVADYAVAGFNRMTEAEIALPTRENSASDKLAE